MKQKFSYRPKRIDFFLQDNFTGEKERICSFIYIPVLDGLNGRMRKMMTNVLKAYRKYRWMYEYDPNRFPSTQKLVIEKIF